MLQFKYLYLLLICLTGPLLVFVYQRIRLYSKQSPEHVALAQKPGHLKAFGCCTQRTSIDVVHEWPKPRDFFESHVTKRKPLLIKNGARVSPAFALWTDDYFLNKLDVPEDSTVNLENGKKEIRGNPTINLNFKEWVKIYNESDRYMVEDLPPYLGKDVVYPPSVQCDGLGDMIVTGVMWFSSGGTKSVVHTDSADNMNCLYRGNKTLVLVDPDKHGDKVPIDKPNGAYSTIDVDSVDYTKYPGLAETDFYYAQMEPGDCMYIPYLWIHQVNSFGSNLAVNLWWDHEKSLTLDLNKCRDPYDRTMTMDKLHFPGFGEYHNDNNHDEDGDEGEEDADLALDGSPSKSAMTFDDFVEEMVEDVDWFEDVAGVGYLEPLKQIFFIMDKNGDGLVRGSEFVSFSQEENAVVNQHYGHFMAIKDAVEKDHSQRQTTEKDHGQEGGASKDEL